MPARDAPTTNQTSSPHAFIRLYHRQLITLLAVTGVLLATSSMRSKSLTYDELSHLTAGVTYWRTGDFRMTPDHPPLAELLATAPLLTMNLEMPPPESPFWQHGFVWGYGRLFLDRPNDVDAMLARARLPMVLLWCAGGLLACAWSGRLFGKAGAVITATLYFLSPNLIAHARLVTTDVPAGVFFLASLFSFCALLERITPLRTLLAALALSALFLTKFSAPLIVPVLVALTLARVLFSGPWPIGGRAQKELNTRARRAVAAGSLVLSLSLAVATSIWAIFGFQYAASPGTPPNSTDHFVKPPHVFETSRKLTDDVSRELTDRYGRTDLSVWQQLVHPSPRIGRIILWARDYSLLPEAYLYGLAYTVQSTSVRWSFLCGKVSENGSWYYFPFAWSIKTPLAIIGVLLLALALTTRRRFRPSPDRFTTISIAAMLLFAALYLLSAMTGNLNLGLRHLIPVQILLFVLGGSTAPLLLHARKLVSWTVPALLACLAFATCTAWPDYLPFFNSFVGGSKNGWKYLADSNVDWGQDLPALAKYLRQETSGDARVAYFGTGRPEYYGIRASYFAIPYEACQVDGGPPGPLADFGPGTYAISATALQGWAVPYEYFDWTDELTEIQTRLGAHLRSIAAAKEGAAGPQVSRLIAEWRLLRYARLLDALRKRGPDHQIGHSILIFKLSPAEIEQIFAPAKKSAQAPRTQTSGK